MGAALLRGWRLRVDKASHDGSAKANITRDATGHVYGVLYRIGAVSWPALDACEPGYRRVPLEVERGGRRLRAHTYLALRRSSDPVAYTWYKQLVLEGAREHALPPHWLARLEALPARDDPHPERSRPQRSRRATRATAAITASGGADV